MCDSSTSRDGLTKKVRMRNQRSGGQEHLDAQKKQTKEVLQSSHSKLFAVFENAPMVMFLVDSEIRVQKANIAAVDFANRRAEEIIGLRGGEAFGCIHSVNASGGCEFGDFCKDCLVRRTVLDTFQTGRSHYRVEAQYPFIHQREQKELFLLISTILFNVSGEKMVLVCIEDITERKRTEELIRAQRDLALALSVAHNLDEGLRLSVEAAIGISGMDCGGVYLVDDISGALNMVFHKGLPPSFVRSASHYDACSDNVRIVMEGKPIYTQYQRLGVPLDENSERENLRAIAVLPILHENRVISCLNVASHSLEDVPVFSRFALEAIAAQIGSTIVRLKAKEALRNSEEIFRNLLEHIQGISIQGYDVDETVRYWNKASEGIYGYTAEEAIGKKLGDLIIPPDLKPLFEKGLRLGSEATKSGEFMPETECDLLRKDGTVVPVQSTHTVVCLEGKKPLLFCIDVDLSAHKQVKKKLLDYQTQLRSLASKLSLTEERERRRIATELHDRISQSLVISKVKLETLGKLEFSEDVTKILNEVCNSLGQSIQDTRSLTFDLSSPILYELGFEAAVAEWLAEQIQEKHGIESQFEDDGEHKPLSDDVRVLLFRMVRELLINVVKHARANRIKVFSRRVDDQIRVSVEDDGIGFNPAEAASMPTQTGGFGLFSVRERLEQFGGHLEIVSELGCGSKITITAPLKSGKITNRGQ